MVSTRASRSTVTLNGTVILAPSAFGQSVATIDKPVTLTPSDHLDIDLRGNPGSGFRLVISVRTTWRRRSPSPRPRSR